MRGLFSLLLTAALAVPAAATADCEVEGVASIDRLRVRIRGEPIRTLAVTDLPVAVRPGRGGHYRDVRVLAPIAFTARSDASIPWTVPRAGAVAGGMLWLGPRVDVEQVREDGDGVVVRVQVDTGVWIGRVHLPCAAIAVGHPEGNPEPPSWATGRGGHWSLRSPRLWLHAEPGAGPAVRIDAPEGLRRPLTELERRGSWVHVVASFPSGAALRGWVRQRELIAPRPPDADRPPFARRIPAPRASRCRRRPPRRGEYVGPAHLAPGAVVRTGPGGAAWATVTEPSVVTVSWHLGSEHARVVHVPGFSSDGPCPEVLRRVWVPRRAVSLQGEETDVASAAN